MISVILVPIICALLIIVLYILLSPRRREDAPAAAQFQLKSALDFISEKGETALSVKEYKALDMLVNKARSYIERAKFEDIYDMTVPLDATIEARQITQSLLLAKPTDSADFLQIIKSHLIVASDYICTYCGISSYDAHKMNLSSFSRKAKEDKARAHLDSVKPKK